MNPDGDPQENSQESLEPKADQVVESPEILERIEKTQGDDGSSGRVEFNTSESRKQCLDERYGPDYKVEAEDPAVYEKRLKSLGLKPEDVKVSRIEYGSESFISVDAAYTKGVNFTQIFTRESFEDEDDLPDLDEIIFTSEDSGKSFGMSEVLPEDYHISIDLDWILGNMVSHNMDAVYVPPLGRDVEVPTILNALQLNRLNSLKKIEPVVLFHEIGHARQNYKWGKDSTSRTETAVKAERDASRYAIQMVRALRERGIDLMPDVDNKQMVNGLEFSLLTYDISHPEELTRRFSSRLRTGTGEKSGEPTNPLWKPLHYLEHYCNIVKALFN
jgi:hypothetical protein